MLSCSIERTVILVEAVSRSLAFVRECRGFIGSVIWEGSRSHQHSGQVWAAVNDQVDTLCLSSVYSLDSSQHAENETLLKRSPKVPIQKSLNRESMTALEPER